MSESPVTKQDIKDVWDRVAWLEHEISMLRTRQERFEESTRREFRLAYQRAYQAGGGQ